MKKISGLLQAFLIITTITTAVLTILAKLAHWFALFEITTHFIFQYFIASFILCLSFALFKNIKFLGVSILLLIINSFNIIPFYLPQNQVENTDTKITIAVVNVFFRNQTPNNIIKWLEENKELDIVLLQELTPEFVKELEKIEQDYPYRIMNPIKNSGLGAALISRKKINTKRIAFFTDKWNYYIYANVEASKNKNLNIYGIHLVTPFKGGREKNQKYISELGEIIAEDSHPLKVLIGDFNLTPYSPQFIDIINYTKLKNTMNGFGIQNSWPAIFGSNLLRIPIDHILITDNIKTMERKIFRLIGTDHYGVVVKLKL